MILDGPACVSMAQQMLHTNAEQLLQLLRDDHLDYFVCEDEILRTEKLGPLQDLIKQYLCQAKHASKFSLPIFADILQNNVEGRPDFDAYETSQAFRALEKYASNLITHPWRQEFRTIKLYSGFYKHHVARHLKGSDQILHLLGYKQAAPAVLAMEEPLDPDTLIVVSRNCLIAACECELASLRWCKPDSSRLRLFKSGLHHLNEAVMYEIVKCVDYRCSYKELFKLRKTFSCDVDTLIDFFQGHEPVKTQKKSDENKTLMSSRNKGEPVRVAQLVDVDSSPEKPKSNLLPGEFYENGYSSSLHPGKIGGDLTKSRPINDASSTKAMEQCATLDDHILASVSALQAQGKQQDLSTRAETWGYVDKTLEKKGLHRGYGNRYDVLEDLDRTKPKASPLPDNEGSASCRKTKAPAQKLPEPQLRPSPMGDGSAVSYQDPDLIQFEHFNNYLPAHGPPMPGSDPYPRYFRPAVDFSYAYRQMGMYGPYDYRPPPHMYPTPPVPSLPPSLPMSSMEMMDTSGALRNHPPTQPPYLPGNPPTDNRRSLYDNVPVTVDERPLDPASAVAHGYPSHMCYPNMYTRAPDPMLMYSAPDYARLPPYAYGVMAPPQIPVDQRPSQRVPESTEGVLIDIGESSPADAPTGGTTRGKSDSQMTIPKAATPPPAVNESSPSPPARTHTPSQSGSSKGSLVCNNSADVAWQCPSCTFLNGPTINICEMCGRSKTKGAESKPLESGGRQCPKCTLVNERDALNCAACETSLKDSPTYI